MKHAYESRRGALSFLCVLGLAACVAEVGDEQDLDVELSSLTTATTVTSVSAQKCLDVPGSNNAHGTGLNVYTCHGQNNQRFRFTEAGELRALSDSRCVETNSSGRAVIGTCNNGAGQKWERRSNGTIVHTQTGKCLDVEGNRTGDRTPVIVWSCNNQDNQRWITDVQAPTPPTGLALQNLRCTSATLSWNASSDDVGVTYYDIYHDGQLMTTVPGNVRQTNLTLVPGVNWGIYVNARDAAGNVSQASANLNVSVPFCEEDRQAPTRPTNLTGQASGTSVNLQWSASTDNVAVRFYDVYRGGTLVGTVQASGSTPPATFFTDAGLQANTDYRYQVAARDAQGNTSERSSELTVRTGQACMSPVCGVQQVTTDSDIPWGLVALRDGTILYGRRDAQDIIRLDPRSGTKTTLGTVPNVQSTDGEGGLLGLAVAADFETNPWLYIMHTSPTDNRVVRMRVTNNRLDTGTSQTLVSGMGRNKFHNGGRLRIGPDGKLYIASGDAQNGDYAQDTRNLAGKILRVNLDGSIPSDNPFGNAVWSYGHRNPQGLTFDSAGRLWAQEFGDGSQDETNVIQRGGNYGWPACEGTRSRSGQGCATPGYIAPKRTYATGDASCSGIAMVRDVLFVACLRGNRLYRLPLRGDTIPDVEQYFVGTYGRLRTVEPSVDGHLWLTTSTRGDKDSIANNSDERIFKVLLR